jgi:hypothetical protein
MKFRKRTATASLLDNFVTQALSYNGYVSRENRDNIFGERLGTNGLPWDGMFIDVVSRDVGLPLPVMSQTPVALSTFIRNGKLYNKPRRGDIVFFETSTVSDYGVPHVGIVVDGSRWETDGLVETIEGMTASPIQRQANGNNGVYQRIRFSYEVLGFGRPFNPTGKVVRSSDSTVPNIAPAQLRFGSKHKNVQLVQLALGMVIDARNLQRGIFDAKTKYAYARFQRTLGYAQSRATGDVDFASLRILGEMTNLFSAIQ